MCVEAVSYTHLDVYKRQILHYMVHQIYGVLCRNYGTIKNGYIYGKPVDVSLAHGSMSSSGLVITNYRYSRKYI